jgi:hypothetical protein
MLTLVAIAVLAILGLKFLWDGQILASPTRAVTGRPVKILGFALLLAGPLAYGCEAVMVGLFEGHAAAPSVMAQRELVFWCILLGMPFLAAVLAIACARPPVKRASEAEKPDTPVG